MKITFNEKKAPQKVSHTLRRKNLQLVIITLSNRGIKPECQHRGGDDRRKRNELPVIELKILSSRKRIDESSAGGGGDYGAKAGVGAALTE